MNADDEDEGSTGRGSGGGERSTSSADGSKGQMNMPKAPAEPEKAPPAHPGTPGRTAEGKLMGSDSGDPDDQEDDEILEESPCKRWSKRREKVKQRDVPGIDAAYLAMDNETGNEVVWNEVLFSERKNFREQEDKIRAVFDNLIRLEHPNLVKFHKYWMDTKSDKPRIIFITEYMSSGSMSRFLQRARSSGSLLNIKAWRSWTRQILSALSYLHSCDPPIVHANLTCNTVFIQQNGLVKIGCVAPKTIHHHVKTFRENIKNVHYLAPEYDHQTVATTQADIYSFGVCALEMATTGALQSGCLNGGGASTSTCAAEKEKSIESGTSATTTGGGGFHMVTEEMVHKAVNSVEDPGQKEFIQRCLEHDPSHRANVTELLNRLGPPEPDKNDETSLDEDGFEQEQHHKAPTEAPISTGPGSRATSPPQETDTATANGAGTSTQIAGQNQPSLSNTTISSIQTKAIGVCNTIPAQHPQNQDGCPTHHHFAVSATITPSVNAAMAKPVTSVSSGMLPINSMVVGSVSTNALSGLHVVATDEGYHTNQSIVDVPSSVEGGAIGGHGDTFATIAAGAPPPQHRETRQVVQLHAELLDNSSDGIGTKLRLQLQLDDQMNRQLTTIIKGGDSGESLAQELVQLGFVSEINSMNVCGLLNKLLSERQYQHRNRTSMELTDESIKTSMQATRSESAKNSPVSSAHPSPHHQQQQKGNAAAIAKRRRAS